VDSCFQLATTLPFLLVDLGKGDAWIRQEDDRGSLMLIQQQSVEWQSYASGTFIARDGSTAGVVGG
jgi:hypothetical protein